MHPKSLKPCHKLQSTELRNRAFRISKFIFGNEISRAAENFLPATFRPNIPTNFIRKKYEWLPEITANFVYWYKNEI